MKQVLIVDDEPLFIEAYTLDLEDAGYKVNVLVSAKEAISYMKSNPDKSCCIILDMMMAHGKELSSAKTDRGMYTGAVLHEELRKINQTVPIIILTNQEVSVVKKHLDMNSIVLHKPSTLPFEVTQLITELIGK